MKACNLLFFMHVVFSEGRLGRRLEEVENIIISTTEISPSTAPLPKPTIPPTFEPSGLPSLSPTLFLEPTSESPTTYEPSVRPIAMPTVSPTQSPSYRPSNAPTTFQPSLEPSAVPTTTHPSLSPSKPAETTTPSKAPSVLVPPSSKPTTAFPTSTQPTYTPTYSPTTYRPTLSPSSVPSMSPTRRPSTAPTSSPTRGPSIAPTLLPTLSPSTAATLPPTTLNPSTAPTPSPTQSPSDPPTPTPTTETPSTIPTVSTTSRNPTNVPTTLSPIKSPTFAPTTLPPTSNPTTAPSLAPTLGDTTSLPTSTAPTTIAPTSPKPSFHPTTSGPNSQPTTVWPTTQSPMTKSPTSQLPISAEPSSIAPSTFLPTTRKPSFSPTKQPTLMTRMPASSSPTPKPTFYPTKAPILSPTTRLPTQSLSTASPSKRPSLSPTTTQPIPVPSHLPTSLQPTRVINNGDILPPFSLQPTTATPTYNPTKTETYQPTALPTLVPTKQPTAWPTPRPTRRPTPAPTPAPTLKPTAWPTPRPSSRPTARPTPTPTARPTRTPSPTLTFQPTSKPTPKPTPVPTSRPTLRPTYHPTMKPTAKPSTSSPTTVFPTTAKPIAQPTSALEPQPTSTIVILTPEPTQFAPVSEPTREATSLVPTTINPTLAPTAAPHPPSAAPTRAPTTSRPTPVPTPAPTQVPTTIDPSPKPSTQPTTLHPTLVPTPSPTTAVPTTAPTVSPTSNVPTDSPSSSVPTIEPTAAPTFKESPIPTSQENNDVSVSRPTRLPTSMQSPSSLTPTTTKPISHEPSQLPSVEEVRTEAPAVVGEAETPSDLPTQHPTTSLPTSASRYPTLVPSAQNLVERSVVVSNVSLVFEAAEESAFGVAVEQSLANAATVLEVKALELVPEEERRLQDVSSGNNDVLTVKFSARLKPLLLSLESYDERLVQIIQDGSLQTNIRREGVRSALAFAVVEIARSFEVLDFDGDDASNSKPGKSSERTRTLVFALTGTLVVLTTLCVTILLVARQKQGRSMKFTARSSSLENDDMSDSSTPRVGAMRSRSDIFDESKAAEVYTPSSRGGERRQAPRVSLSAFILGRRRGRSPPPDEEKGDELLDDEVRLFLQAPTETNVKDSYHVRHRIRKFEFYSSLDGKEEMAGVFWTIARNNPQMHYVRRIADDGSIELVAADEGVGGLRPNKILKSLLNNSLRLSFEERTHAFREQADALRIPWQQGRVHLDVRRGYALNDAYDILKNLSPDEWRQPFFIRFEGEVGMDAGGLSREFFEIASEQLFDHGFHVFRLAHAADGDEYLLTDDDDVFDQEVVTERIAFCGKFLGKALLEGHQIRPHPSIVLLKHIACEPVDFSDLQIVDTHLWSSLSKLIAMPSDQLSALEFAFTVTREHIPNNNNGQAQKRTVELCPEGSQRMVTAENLDEFIRLRFKERVLDSFQTSLVILLQSIYSIIPPEILMLLTARELELALCGIPTIDIIEWKAATEYGGDLSADSAVVIWFWQVLESWNNTQRTELLAWSTGTSRPPIRGFRFLHGRDGDLRPFTLTSVALSQAVYPRSHTCFNRIDLPLYNSKQDLQHALDFILSTFNLTDNHMFSME